jgi:hypothetical protein
MIFIEASDNLRLRPSHLLLMIYRYMSGVYQAGDLSALSYTKGYLDASSGSSESKRVLTVSGHGIGEAESWLADHIAECQIDAVSFRLVDTQLLQFLRAAEPHHIESVLDQFTEMVAPFPVLAKLMADPGLTPYWCDQSKAIKQLSDEERVSIFGVHPEKIPAQRLYDLIYVSHGEPFLTRDSVAKLREHLAPDGSMAVLVRSQPNGSGSGTRTEPFAGSTPVLNAIRYFDSYIEERGYSVAATPKPGVDLADIARVEEPINFSVLAPADSVLIGELILMSLPDHIPDQARLVALNEAASRFTGLQAPVSESLKLFLLGTTGAK